MLEEIETLVIIQDRDQKILQLRKDLEQMPRLIEHAQARLSKDQATVAKCKETTQANEMAIKKLELDIGQRRETIKRLKDQQFETRKNEEYQALGHEAERYQAEVAALEDQELELMERAEELKAEMESAQGALSRCQEIVDRELAQLEERRKNDEERIAELEAEKAKFVPRVDATLYETYQRTFKKKRDAAVVAVIGGQCKGCHMKVTTATIAQAKAEQTITRCDHCGRILYYEE